MNDTTTIFPALQQSHSTRVGVVNRVRQWLRMAACGLNGHALYLDTTDRTVLRERCTCGFTTPGIPVGGTHYTPKYAGDPSRLRMPRV